MRKVDAEIRRIIDEQYAIARKLIEDNRDKIEAMVKALLDWETIDTEQIDDTRGASATPAEVDGVGAACRWQVARRRYRSCCAACLVDAVLKEAGTPAFFIAFLQCRRCSTVRWKSNSSPHGRLRAASLRSTACCHGHCQRYARFVCRWRTPL